MDGSALTESTAQRDAAGLRLANTELDRVDGVFGYIQDVALGGISAVIMDQARASRAVIELLVLEQRRHDESVRRCGKVAALQLGVHDVVEQDADQLVDGHLGDVGYAAGVEELAEGRVARHQDREALGRVRRDAAREEAGDAAGDLADETCKGRDVGIFGE